MASVQSTTTRDLGFGQAPAEPDGFVLDVTLMEVADPAGLVNITNDNCGSTCGACTTGVA